MNAPACQSKEDIRPAVNAIAVLVPVEVFEDIGLEAFQGFRRHACQHQARPLRQLPRPPFLFISIDDIHHFCSYIKLGKSCPPERGFKRGGLFQRLGDKLDWLHPIDFEQIVVPVPARFGRSPGGDDQAPSGAADGGVGATFPTPAG